MTKYFKCENCGSILETIFLEDLECLSCEWKVLEEITEWAPQWVKWCWSCSKKLTCTKMEND